MRPVIYLAAMSLDGFLAGPNDELDWLPTESDYDFDGFLAGINTVVMGRRTWEVINGFDGPWPYPGKEAWVVSRTLKTGAREHATVTAEDPAALLGRLKEQDGGGIWLLGGGVLARTCLDAGLIDELRITVIPVVLGAGLPLIGPGTGRHGLTLTGTERFSGGMVELTYKVDQEVNSIDR